MNLLIKQIFESNYFNRIELERVREVLQRRKSASEKQDTSWRYHGQLETGGSFEIELSDQSATISLPTGISRWEQAAADAGLSAEAGFDSSPPGSGGIILQDPRTVKKRKEALISTILEEVGDDRLTTGYNIT